jgi:predicted pyridoxine 5'-phosphate oxidase superfamily flavin-nucleotide-binding protein
MSGGFAKIAFTPAVRALQESHGSRAQYARMQARSEPAAGLGPDESEFLAAADSFYLATVSETGWPYVQHRGGPRGFLKVLSPRRIGFADFRGNQQFVSAGNAATDDRVSIIVMDYVLSSTGGPGRANRRGRVRLELSAAHHATLHAGSGGGGGAATTRTDCCARRRAPRCARRVPSAIVGVRTANRIR